MGGSAIQSAEEIKRREQAIARMEAEELERAKRLAKRIVSHLNKIVIRPGPKPEERECTKVAKELEAEIPAIAEMIHEEL